jgi:peptide deformylase
VSLSIDSTQEEYFMASRKILLLGNPELYRVSAPIHESELSYLSSVIADLHDTLLDFRFRHQAGRAIAAPQIGVMKRIIYMHIHGKSIVFINPLLENKSAEMFELWDDCLCFPDLLVKVRRHKSCRILYKGANWKEEVMDLDNSLSELLQHECDHLDGILAVSRAIDGQSFALKSQCEIARNV